MHNAPPLMDKKDEWAHAAAAAELPYEKQDLLQRPTTFQKHQ